MTTYTYIALDSPLAPNGIDARGINDSGQIVGRYTDSGGTHGFMYSNGVYTIANVAANTSYTVTASRERCCWFRL